MRIYSEPLILAIDCCTRAGSVCLARGDQVLASAIGDETSSHSTDLIDNVKRILNQADAKLSDVDLFAATVGPGSFTGLRIGLATVKGFAVATSKPCAGVSTLAAIALGAGASTKTVSILPAGRGEVYVQLFSVAEGKVQALDTESHIDPSRLLEKYGGGSITLAGEGVPRVVQTLRVSAEGKGNESEGSNLTDWTSALQTEPLAHAVAVLALADYRRGLTINADELRANYVRPSDAEIKERWQHRA
jgi:tRNA threonylcarbamoyladenosine biosynthesis protein TsaB